MRRWDLSVYLSTPAIMEKTKKRQRFIIKIAFRLNLPSHLRRLFLAALLVPNLLKVLWFVPKCHRPPLKYVSSSPLVQVLKFFIYLIGTNLSDLILSIDMPLFYNFRYFIYIWNNCIQNKGMSTVHVFENVIPILVN